MNNSDRITGQELVEFRAKYNMSMQALAERAHLSLQTIWFIETGRTIATRLSTEKLYQAFDKIEAEARRAK